MIASYKDEDTERFAMGVRVRRFVSFERVALRKIRQLQVCASLDDLRVPPGNRLEALSGNSDRTFVLVFHTVSYGSDGDR